MTMNLNTLYKKREILENIIGLKVDGNGDGWGQFVYNEVDRKQAKQELKQLEIQIEKIELGKN